MWKFVIGLVLGIFIGVNTTTSYLHYGNIWSEERGGLLKLNELMKDDKSQRLFMIAITAEKQYAISSMPPEYQFYGQIIKKGAA